MIPVSSRFGKDAIASFEETLVSVLENRPDRSEIIVVLGCEYADPWNIREEVEFVRAPEGASVVACINVGLASCAGEVVHVLAPGWKATPDWTVGPMARFEDSKVGAVVPLVVSHTDRETVVAQGLAYRFGGRRVVIKPRSRDAAAIRPACGPLLQAGFWRADVLELDGHGFSVACGDSHADADLAVTLRAAGYETVVEPESRVIDSSAKQPCCGPFAMGLAAERLFWRSAAGHATSLPLVAHGAEIIRHAVARAPLGTIPALAGRMLAVLQFGSYRSRYGRLKALAAARGDEADRPILRMDDGQEPLRGPRDRRRESLRRSA